MIRLPRIHYFFACTLCLCLTAGALAAQPHYAGSTPPKGKTYPDVESQVLAARPDLEAGSAAVIRGDKGTGKKSLSRAQEVLEKALKTNPSSRGAAEALGMVYFYQDLTENKPDFDRSIHFLREVTDVDPDAVQAGRYLTQAYARHGDAHETIVYANRTMALSTDSALTRELTALKQSYQENFLGSWYEYGKYYESNDAKLTQYNPQTYKLDLVLQVTPQFESDLAAKGFQSVTQNQQLSQDAELQKYLQKLVDNLVAKTPGGPPFTYKVDVVESPQINAMAMPGHILVNTGLVKFAESEAELVTVLSHEIGHIYAHHSARALLASYRKRMIASQLLAAVKVDNSRLRDQLLTLGVGIGLDLLDKGYSRGEEKEADRFGTHIAFNAGYNPTFMTKFFLRLYEANPKQPFRLLSTHPPTPERIEYTTAYLEAFPLETEMQIDSQEFKDMKKRIK